MKIKSNRIKERFRLESILKKIHDYAYLETIIIVALYLSAGYLIDSNDICMLNGKISYILILLSVITLFHGFENGMLALGIIAMAMWYFYPTFQYIEFLVTLMMTMIFSEFHYYWTKKIKEAELNADYRGAKLDELSKAFYTLKISHDQLEKNYIVKPMSIRNSIEYIINKNREVSQNQDIEDKYSEYYKNFIGLLEKSFNVYSAVILYKKSNLDDELIDENNTNIALGSENEDINIKELLDDYLVDKAISRKSPIYISDQSGEPTVVKDNNSKYIAAIPAIQDNRVASILVIKKMPFMAFNRENLTSIAILLEYFSVEIRNKNILSHDNEFDIIEDEKFRFEYIRLKNLYKKYNVGSVVLVLRIDNELQSIRIYEKIMKMLRSLDMVTMVEQNDLYYITLLFPLHDKAAALGYLNRLLNSLDEDKDKNFNHMTFDMSQIDLLNRYLREDYDK
jgi:hypothetical protein